jgi:Tfp pilus assembly protein PilO
MEIKNFFSQNTDDKKRMFLFFIIIIFVVYVDLAFVLKKQIGFISSLKEKIKTAQLDLESINAGLSRMRNCSTVDNNKNASSFTTTELFSEERMPDILELISAAANGANVRINQIRPVKDYKAKIELSNKIKAIPVNITLEAVCGYHELGLFIDEMEGRGIFFLQSLKISPTNDYSRQNVSIVIKTYVQ